MARSKTSIMNRALDMIGAANITSPTQNSKSARALNRAWDPVLDFLLSKHDWGFAIKRDELAQSATDPDYEYDRQYTLPNDFIRLLEVHPKYLKHRLEGQFIVANTDTLRIKYVAKITDPNEFSADFAELLAKGLAAEICFKITQSRTLTVDKKAEFKEAMRWAMSDASKSSGTPLPSADDVWMSHRGYFADPGGEATVADDFDYGSVT